MLRAPERAGYQLEEFQKLEYLVKKTRFLASNLEEEYKQYENAIDTKEKAELDLKIRKANFSSPQRNSSVPEFNTYSLRKNKKKFDKSEEKNGRNSPQKYIVFKNSIKSDETSPLKTIDHKRVKSQIYESKTPEVSMGDKLKSFIDHCLHKIYPKKPDLLEVKSTQSNPNKMLLIDKHERNKQFLGNTLEVLRKCLMTDSSQLGSDINDLMKKFKEEYIKTEEVIEMERKIKETPGDDEIEEQKFSEKFH